jgi:hypothetical protein
MAAYTVSRPLDWPLTKDNMHARSFAPLYLGDDVSFRFQLRDSDDVAVSLSGATIVMTITPTTGSAITRSSATTITGSGGTYQVKADTDQSAETGDTGKGWYQCNFTHYAEDTTALGTLGRGRHDYKIVVTLGSGVVLTHFAGKIDIL